MGLWEWLKSKWGNRLAAEILRYTHQDNLFNAHGFGKVKPPAAYSKDGIDLSKFQEVYIRSKAADGLKIGLWYKPPKHKDSPVYFAFHGRSGHWGRASDCPEDSPDTWSPDYRLHLLDALAKGAHGDAGVVAVFTRGFGLSRPPGDGVTISERLIDKDLDALKAFAEEKGITPERSIITAESWGGYSALRFAQKMTRPPAILALINTFRDFSYPVHRAIADVSVTKDIPWLKQYSYTPGKHCNRETLAELLRVKNVLFDNEKAMQELSGKLDVTGHVTKLYLAHSPLDNTIDFGQAKTLEAAFGKPEHTTFVELNKSPYLDRRYTDHHVNWNPYAIVHDLEELYRKIHMPPSPEVRAQTHTQGSYETRHLRNGTTAHR